MTGSVLDEHENYDFLFRDSSLTRAMAGQGFMAVDFEKGRGSSKTDWSYWFFDEESGSPRLIEENIHPDYLDAVIRNVSFAESGRSEPVEQIFRVRRKDGEWIWVLHKGAVIYRTARGKARLYLAIETDITRMMETEAELLEQKQENESRAIEAENLLQAGAVITSSLHIDETVNLILEHIQKVIPYKQASVQLLTEEGLKIIGVKGFDDPSKVIGMIFPYPSEGRMSTNVVRDKKLIICRDLKTEFPEFYDPDAECPTLSWLGIPLIFRGEVIGILALDHQEKDFYSEKHLKLAGGFASFVAVAMANARHHEKAHRMAMEDPLMKIGTRYNFDIRGSVLFSNAQRKHGTISLAMADLDHFKKINDTYGHNTGDMVLREIGMLCLREFRTSDVVARFGGDEIIFLFADLDLKAAEAVMNRFRETVRNHSLGSVKEKITMSIGIVSRAVDRADTFEEMIESADRMMYRVKRSGRDRIICFSI